VPGIVDYYMHAVMKEAGAAVVIVAALIYMTLQK